jgi:hypothetical protein
MAIAMRSHRVSVWFIGALILGATGCAARMPHVAVATQSRSIVRVQHRWLLLHLSRPPVTSPRRPLVVFVTGDGGWRGKDLDAFNHLIEWGYPVVAFSAPDYLNHLARAADSVHPAVLANDFAGVIDTARTNFGLPPAGPVVLTGVSRGADLVVVAAAQRALSAPVTGVLAVALTKEEEYVRHHRHGRRHGRAAPDDSDWVMAEPYALLPDVQAPVCVIQSAHDEYVPASEARSLFGPDTPTRRLYAIASRNHSFSDARDDLYEAMRTSLAWLAAPEGTAPAAGGDH